MYFTFGAGVLMLAAAAVLLIAGLAMLTKLLRTDWNMSVHAFNAKFAHESSLGKTDMELDSRRRAIARELGVSQAGTSSAAAGGVVSRSAAGGYSAVSAGQKNASFDRPQQDTEAMRETEAMQETEVLTSAESGQKTGLLINESTEEL